MTLVPLLLAAVCSSTGNDVVASVDQAVISRVAFARRYADARAQGRPPAPSQLIETLVWEALLAAEGRRLGLLTSPEVRAYVDGETQKAAARALVDDLGASAKIDDGMLRTLFHATSDFVKFEKLSFASQRDADAALERIRKGGSFEGEAKRAVVATLFSKPADAQWIMRAQLGAPAAAIFGVAPGQIVGPIDDAGWALLRLVEKQIGTDADFGAHREALVRSARRQASEAGRKHLVDQLRAKAGVTLDEQFLSKVDARAPSPQQLAHVIATVGGSPLRYGDIDGAVRALGSSHLAGPSVKIQLAWAAVDDRLLQRAAIQNGYDKAPAVVAQRPELERYALSAAYADRIRAAVPAPSEDEIEELYRRNAARYLRPFEQVLPVVAADAMTRKRNAAVRARVDELRKKASISIDAKTLESAARE